MTTFRSCLVSVVVALAIIAHSPVLLAQETTSLPPPESVPRDSAVDVSTLPPPSSPRENIPAKVKPLRVPDPRALREGKDLLQQVPGALPPAPGFVEDTAPRNRK